MSTKVKYELEFPIQASPQLLYNYISTPSGLSEWFADNVNSRGELFTFIWDDSEEQAKLLTKKNNTCHLLQTKQENLLIQVELQKKLDGIDESLKHYRVERQEYLLDRWDLDHDLGISFPQRPLSLKTR